VRLIAEKKKKKTGLSSGQFLDRLPVCDRILCRRLVVVERSARFIPPIELPADNSKR
jgi:hypothetical protein